MKITETDDELNIDGMNLESIYQRDAESLIKYFVNNIPNFSDNRKNWIDKLCIGDLVVYEKGSSYRTGYKKTRITNILSGRLFKTTDINSGEEREWDSFGLETKGDFLLEPYENLFYHVKFLGGS